MTSFSCGSITGLQLSNIRSAVAAARFPSARYTVRSAGFIFLPAGGDGDGDATLIGQGGVYWTSNFDQDKGPCVTYVGAGGMGVGGFKNPYKELSLRLIHR